ncbi:uncharacterized protein NECHADRAFT_122747 [Fusarium vanettenii 77-13-4]|uniref:Uncharacterized protein n=1 Tax=Fusarium vanettenii (strain ATCC MYA-4622 / CBS 123669 / FGSC 9596 / NRRL 45880 / 77-13-4) TaxID=660122 RepID=C7Z438_FUSV7|nr:uncharacterized protein NECHADRAFT_122747 [Fusarium vanettenii 77-13-4]EEU41409.1 hypothetical protein NECHADRAFT_122747 [Fusarium vanettenii 77-13-4]
MGGNMSTVDERLKACRERYQRFTLKEQKDHREHAFLCFSDDVTFGHLRSGIGKVLLSLMSKPNVEFEPIGETLKLREVIERAGKPSDAIVKVNIDVYGPRNSAKDVGDELSRAKLWLQRSDTSHIINPGIEYHNPHFLRIRIRGSDAEILQPSQPVVNNATARKQTREEQLRKMVEEVYKTVGSNRDVDRAEGGSRVTRELLDHQKEALGFMLERESGHIAEKYRLWREVNHPDGTVEYIQKITRKKKTQRPDEKGGGILADEMGMGKSLSILALVMRTLDQGQEWAKEKNEENKDRKSVKFSRSTLVVVSAALLIDNWISEIKKHLKAGLRVIKYHGNSRKDQADIGDSDIVVTTYHTLSAEYQVKKGKTSPLHQIGWYRVVLDEAHIIRRPTTTFYRACNSLEACSRWCLTGTPIQNKLADIGTLFSFIKADSFKEPAVFRKWIENAYEQNAEDPEQVKNRLVLLLQALCLRRTREVLNLPSTSQNVRKLDFSPEEREQYTNTKNILVRTIKNRVGEIESSSKFGLFQMRLQLRILCNHGTYQKAFSWHRRSLQDEKEALIGSFGGHREMTCAGCQQPMPILGSNWADGGGFTDHCAHVLCSECIDESTWAGSGVPAGRCPVCVRWSQPSRHASGTDQDVEMTDAPVKKSSAEDDHEHYFNNTGISTKMRAIIEDVRVDLGTTKSIIFSCWTRTLHLLSKHLEEAKIPFHQIDGDCPIPKRQAKLDAFDKNDDVQVLIMTTGTGAFGLNLTCANRIFIAELQWNPSVENQAIARAIRLGQENEVRVTRYIIKDTVEVMQEMMAQQRHKKNLAALGFDDYDEDWMDPETQARQ